MEAGHRGGGGHVATAGCSKGRAARRVGAARARPPRPRPRLGGARDERPRRVKAVDQKDRPHHRLVRVGEGAPAHIIRRGAQQ